MKTIENEATTTLEAQVAPNTETQEQKAPTKAKGAKQARRVAPAKPKATKKAKAPKAAKQAAKAPKKAAKPKAEGVRSGSKTSAILDLLQRAKGATLAEIREATSRQVHSVRGFISGILGKKMGLSVKSEIGLADSAVLPGSPFFMGGDMLGEGRLTAEPARPFSFRYWRISQRRNWHSHFRG